MSFIRVPGYGGIYVVDTGNGDVFRVGNEGGLRNPQTNQLNSGMRFDALGGGLGTAALQALQAYGGGGGGGGGEEGGGGFEGAGFEMSPEEKQLLDLQIGAIQQSQAQQAAIFAREEARRAAYGRWVRGERWEPTNMDQQQGILAARADKISGIEQERLEKALNGELPVSPSTERAISENADILNERLRRAGGPGYETSEAGAKELARADESAAILREADQKAYIERGIQPSVTASQFAQQAVGQYVPQEIPGLSSALQGLQLSRAREGQLGLGYAQNELGYAGLDAKRQMFEEAQAADYIRSRQGSSDGGFFGSGFGKLLGSLIGGAAGYYTGGRSSGGGANIYGQGQGYS